MARLPQILFVLLTCSTLGSTQRTASCTKPKTVNDGSPFPACDISKVPPGTDSNPVYGAGNCCKWTNQTLSVKCCEVLSQDDPPTCAINFSTSACICRPLPTKTTPCDKKFYYGKNPPANANNVQKCCQKNKPNGSQCCELGACPDSSYNNANCKSTAIQK